MAISGATQKGSREASTTETATGPTTRGAARGQANRETAGGQPTSGEPERKQHEQTKRLPAAEFQPPALTTKVNGRLTAALLDCGATRSFINTKLVTTTGWEAHALQEAYHFEGATGELGMATEVLYDAELEVLSWKGTRPLIIAGIKQEVI